MEEKKKPFMTYEQQIRKLRDDKKLKIEDEAYAIQLLKEHSYFALISGYKGPFKAKNGNYKLYTTINDIYSLYKFDDRLRALFLQYILKIEKHMKSLISYSFCEAYGEEQQYYLDATKYNYVLDNQKDINELIARLTKVTEDVNNYPYIKHQKKEYGNIPLWVLIKALTIGTVSKMYSFLPQGIQHNVSKEFLYVHEGMLVRMLDILSRVRNVCAHNERLYDYRYHKGSINDTYIHKNLAIKKKGDQYTKGKNDLFAVVIVIKFLSNESDFLDFTCQLEQLLDSLLHSTQILQCSQMYRYMGFPSNWKDINTVNKGNIDENLMRG